MWWDRPHTRNGCRHSRGFWRSAPARTGHGKKAAPTRTGHGKKTAVSMTPPYTLSLTLPSFFSKQISLQNRNSMQRYFSKLTRGQGDGLESWKRRLKKLWHCPFNNSFVNSDTESNLVCFILWDLYPVFLWFGGAKLFVKYCFVILNF